VKVRDQGWTNESVNHELYHTPLNELKVRDQEWTNESATVMIPAVGASATTGRLLQDGAKVELELTVNTTMAWTFNVLAELLSGGRTNETVVVGAHLDSVPAGPGINDNGSGSAALLEIALQLARLDAAPVNNVLMAWWGAEEIGLIGSRHFVRDHVNPSTPSHYNIVANLNYDSLGSPNYNRQLYAGDTSPDPAKDGSTVLENLFSKYFFGQALAVDLIPFSTTGGSDYFPFIAAGIPAGSIASGSGGIKSIEERNIFGGIAEAPYDSCYHKACDTVENINLDSLAELCGAAAFVTMQVIQTPNPAASAPLTTSY
jgi:Zn-dependent M28 family amino/carboxypeptidase